MANLQSAASDQALELGLDIDVDINTTPSWEKQEFSRIRREQGVKAAIAWRDACFRDGAQ